MISLAAADSWLKLLRTLYTQNNNNKKKEIWGRLVLQEEIKNKAWSAARTFWGLSATCLWLGGDINIYIYKKYILLWIISGGVLFFLLCLNCHERARSRGRNTEPPARKAKPSPLLIQLTLDCFVLKTLWVNILLLHPSSQQGPFGGGFSVELLFFSPPWNFGGFGTKDIPPWGLLARQLSEAFFSCWGFYDLHRERERRVWGGGLSPFYFYFYFFFLPKICLVFIFSVQ